MRWPMPINDSSSAPPGGHAPDFRWDEHDFWDYATCPNDRGSKDYHHAIQLIHCRMNGQMACVPVTFYEAYIDAGRPDVRHFLSKEGS